MKIHVVDREGKEHVLEGREGWTLMEVLRDAGLPIAAECGGACACATCHVYLDQNWFVKLGEPSESEVSMLDITTGVEPTSRLSCQITCDVQLDGIRLILAPE